MIYKSMNFEEISKNNYVMKFGELGTKFYIVLRGKTSVRVPSIVEKNFTFRELLELLHENKEWIVENNNYQAVLKLIQDVFPDLVSDTYKRCLKLNHDNLKKVLRGKIISEIQNAFDNGIPSFESLSKSYGNFLF